MSEVKFSPFDSRGRVKPASAFTPAEINSLNGAQLEKLETMRVALELNETAEAELASADADLRAKVVSLNDARTRKSKLTPITAMDAVKAHLRTQRALTLARHGIKQEIAS